VKITYSTQPHTNTQWVFEPSWLPQCFLARWEGRIVTVIGVKNNFTIGHPMEWRVIDSEEIHEGCLSIEKIGP